MANLKNIADLPIIESADGVNLIVNDNGSAKQITASAVGAQADFNVTDENHPAFIKNKPVAVQADWNQNDATAADYVKNRTHWEETGVETILLSETTLDFTATGPSGGKWGIINFEFEDGKTYKVKWDDIVYECVAQSSGVGNHSILGESGGSNEPFWIGSYSGVSIMTSEVGTHIVSISVIEEVIHKLDSKYLPKLMVPFNSVLFDMGFNTGAIINCLRSDESYSEYNESIAFNETYFEQLKTQFSYSPLAIWDGNILMSEVHNTEIYVWGQFFTVNDTYCDCFEMNFYICVEDSALILEFDRRRLRFAAITE